METRGPKGPWVCSPKEKVKAHSGAIYKGPLMLSTNSVFLLINARGRTAKHNEGASILTLKQQNTVTKKTHFFQNMLIAAFFQSPFYFHSVLPVQCHQL